MGPFHAEPSEKVKGYVMANDGVGNTDRERAA